MSFELQQFLLGFCQLSFDVTCRIFVYVSCIDKRNFKIRVFINCGRISIFPGFISSFCFLHDFLWVTSVAKGLHLEGYHSNMDNVQLDLLFYQMKLHSLHYAYIITFHAQISILF